MQLLLWLTTGWRVTPPVQPFLKSSDGTVILLSCGFGQRFELPFLSKTGLHVGLRTPRSGWPDLTPVAVAVIRELGWWCVERGAIVRRLDEYERGCVRSFHLGFDSESILYEWLIDWRCRAILNNAVRVR